MSKSIRNHHVSNDSKPKLMILFLPLQENTSLQLLDLTSPHILLGDAALQVTLTALAKNRSLRFLVLNGWTIQVEVGQVRSGHVMERQP